MRGKYAKGGILPLTVSTAYRTVALISGGKGNRTTKKDSRRNDNSKEIPSSRLTI